VGSGWDGIEQARIYDGRPNALLPPILVLAPITRCTGKCCCILTFRCSSRNRRPGVVLGPKLLPSHQKIGGGAPRPSDKRLVANTLPGLNLERKKRYASFGKGFKLDEVRQLALRKVDLSAVRGRSSSSNGSSSAGRPSRRAN
jgi:hypothetical protein